MKRIGCDCSPVSSTVLAGGPTATSNAEPFSDFFDLVALGDGEELLVEIGECLQRCKDEGLDREAVLLRLSTSVPGVYVPQFYSPVQEFGGAVYPNREGVPEKIVRRCADNDGLGEAGTAMGYHLQIVTYP